MMTFEDRANELCNIADEFRKILNAYVEELRKEAYEYYGVDNDIDLMEAARREQERIATEKEAAELKRKKRAEAAERRKMKAMEKKDNKE